MRRAATFIGIAFLVAGCGAGAAGPAPTARDTDARPAASAPASAAPVPAADATAAGTLGERRNEGAGIEVKAAWVSTDPPALKITMDTHSVDLDKFDLATLAKLRLDGGDWVAASAVDVPKGGHHREGTLRFAPVGPSFGAARVIELEIRDVAVPVRVLRWERGS